MIEAGQLPVGCSFSKPMWFITGRQGRLALAVHGLEVDILHRYGATIP